MRYLHPTFQEATLRRGKSIEQFLGGVAIDGQRHVVWLELRPRAIGVEIWRFIVPDLGDTERIELYEFGGEENEALVATLATPTDALAFASAQAGAAPDRWANQFVIQDDYRDYILGGRSLRCSAPGI